MATHLSGEYVIRMCEVKAELVAEDARFVLTVKEDDHVPAVRRAAGLAGAGYEPCTVERGLLDALAAGGFPAGDRIRPQAAPAGQPGRRTQRREIDMTTISASDPRRYVWLAGSLEKGIESGRYAPGKRLPSIGELCTDFGLSRQTAGKALRLLEDEGLIERVPGLGYFVPSGS
jgi:DNA-binding transcriptional ArsR family regulator